MSDSDSREPLSNISDSSFVILGLGSLPNQTNECLSKYSNSKSVLTINDTGPNFESGKSSNGDSKTFSRCNYSDESIQEKLNDLVVENYKLKETLRQNNLAIKSKLDTFFLWQQEVLKTHKTHKQKFLETKDLILKLRMENMNFKKQLEKFPQGLSFYDTYAQESKNIEDLGKLNEKIKNFESIYNQLVSKNEILDIENHKLSEELQGTKNEILRLNTELENILRENTFLKQESENLCQALNKCTSYKSLPNAESYVQISILFKQLEKEKTEVLKLKDALEKAVSVNTEALEAKLSTTTKLMQYVDHSLDQQSQRFSSCNSWIYLAEKNSKENQISEGVECNLMCEIQKFNSHLNVKENAFKEKQETIEDMKKLFSKLLKDYKALQKNLRLLTCDNQTIKKYKEEISNLSAELQTKSEQLTLKQQEYDCLIKKVEELNLECEKVAILQIQVELCQKDFNCERELREKLAIEKEQMADQVRFLQSKINELEKLNAENNGHQKTSPLESPGKKTTYLCPKCSFSFSNLSTCEKHIDECLNIFMYP